jgi:hypothetical protein
MYILYIDDSGSVANANEQYFVLAGLAVYEKTIFHLIDQSDKCVADFQLGDEGDIELHATDIYGGRGFPWKQIKSRPEREGMIQSVMKIITDQRSNAVKLFAVAVDKKAISPLDPVHLAFEEICNRFNLFLQRNHDRTGHNNRGLIVMDETRHERPLQSMARNFRVNGAKWGKFRYLAEVPFFVDSKATRLIQLADMVAWSTFRNYEHKDGRFFNQLLPKFDSDGGVIHGLLHARGTERNERCHCPACLTREAKDR